MKIEKNYDLLSLELLTLKGIQIFQKLRLNDFTRIKNQLKFNNSSSFEYFFDKNLYSAKRRSH